MVTTFYPPYHFGGDAVYVYRLARELGRRGHDVDVVHDLDAYRLLHRGEPAGDWPPSERVTVHRLHSRLGPLSPLATQQTGLPLFKPGLRRLLDGGAHDVIHFHNTSLIGPGAFRYGRGVKLYTMHEQWLVCPLHFLWKGRQGLCDAPRCTWCSLRSWRPPQWWRATGALSRHLRHIDHFVAPSRFVQDVHRERGLDLPLTVLPTFAPDVASAPPDDPRPHARPYFLFVGRLVKPKGVGTLLDAFRRITSADLVVAGDGDEAPTLRNAASEMIHVRFLGPQPYERLRTLYRHALALVVPSICYEVFPLVILEAFAEGTPVIARDLGGMSDMVRESGGGLLFRDETTLREALERLQADAGLRSTLGASGRRTVRERWNADAHVRAYLRIVETCREAKRSAAGDAS